MEISDLRTHLLAGQAIPALPLALDADAAWDKRQQRAVLRYYLDAGVGGIAVGVHSTQFEIREPQHALFKPLLLFASREIDAWLANKRPLIKIAGICGDTKQALGEADLAKEAGYHAGLLSLAAWKSEPIAALLSHCQSIAERIPIIGFYLQPAVGGRNLSYQFWRAFAEIPNVLAIKIAPFNRYQTFDVVRAVMDSGREDIALYTGNDDNIIVDLLTPWVINGKTRFIAGGLLGQFGVWTKRAVELLEKMKRVRGSVAIPADWLTKNAEWTDANAAIFDAQNSFAGVIPGIHEVLRRQGLLATTRCLNPHERLSLGQSAELDRVTAAYPWLTDIDFVAKHLESWLRD